MKRIGLETHALSIFNRRSARSGKERRAICAGINGAAAGEEALISY
jgi:hypothetical protein